MNGRPAVGVAICWSAFIVLWLTGRGFGGEDVEVETTSAAPRNMTVNAHGQLVQKGTLTLSPDMRAVECLNATVPDFGDLLTHTNSTVKLSEVVSQIKTRHPKANNRWGPSTTGPKVIMTYSACHGSLSQHFGHLSALSIAKGLQPDVVVLPHARTRKTFQSRNLLGAKDVNKTNTWSEVPLTAVYDLSSFENYLSGIGVKMATFPTPPGPVTLPDTYKGYETHWHAALPLKFGLPETTPVVGLRYKRRRPLYVWVQILNRQLVRYHREPLVIVDLGCTDILIGANPNFTAIDADIENLQAAHHALRIADYLHSAADQVKQQLPLNYTSVHLRIERDMIADNAVGRWWRAHLRAKSAFLDPIKELPAYVASGIFEYMPEDEQKKLLAPYIATHKMFRACGVEHVPNDIRPWVDFFVLIGGWHFQGHEYSVLTWLVIQQRLLEGRGLSQHSLVKKKGPPRNPQCCENDRCLTYQCALRDGDKLVDFRVNNITVEDVLAPVSFDN